VREAWELRNAAAFSLVRIEEHFRGVVSGASPADLIELLDSFSPARSPGPEWTRSFDQLIERLWAWCAPQLLADVRSEYEARGSAWSAIANALAPDEGARIRARLASSQTTRLPPFTLA
jgi:hypothetical protein